MVEVIPFEYSHQQDVSALLDVITSEFDKPISPSGPKPSLAVKLDEHWVAINDGQLAGTIGVLKLKGENAVLKSMFVGREFRGIEKRVSNSLLQTLIEWCKENDMSSIFLGTMTQFKAAHRFYERNGFRRVDKSELPTDFVRNPVDDVFYLKKVSLVKQIDIKFAVREAVFGDLDKLISLARSAWKGYENVLGEEHWFSLERTLSNRNVFIDLLNKSHCLICETEENEIIGMSFLVPSGNPDEIYEANWAHLRFVSVNPNFGGQGIGKLLTEKCIEKAKENGEKIVALHTSEIMGRAMGIYQSLGFVALRELEQRLGKRYWLFLLEL